jgi:hypothetical protein
METRSAGTARNRLKLIRQFLGRAAGAYQLDHLATEFRCVGWSCLRHRGLLEHKCSGVHETGSTSELEDGKAPSVHSPEGHGDGQ